MISSFINDPISTLVFLLLAMPGRLLAISFHEFAHAWVAYKCGDPTAKNMGRLTINPLAHLDLVGFLMMMLAGFGWAKPVPVNPRYYRNFRRDDLKVSLAGITMNILMFIFGMTLMYVFVGMALHKASLNTAADGYYIMQEYGMKLYLHNGMYITLPDLLQYAPYMSEYLIAPAFGQITRYVYEMIMYFSLTNLVLAIFNLIPVPPLDGYHVLDDLVLCRLQIRMPPQARQWLMLIMMVLIFSGGSSWLIGSVQEMVFVGVGNIAEAVFEGIGLI